MVEAGWWWWWRLVVTSEHLEDLLLHVERLGGRLAVVGAAVELGGIAVLGGAAE